MSHCVGETRLDQSGKGIDHIEITLKKTFQVIFTLHSSIQQKNTVRLATYKLIPFRLDQLMILKVSLDQLKKTSKAGFSLFLLCWVFIENTISGVYSWQSQLLPFPKERLRDRQIHSDRAFASRWELKASSEWKLHPDARKDMSVIRTQTCLKKHTSHLCAYSLCSGLRCPELCVHRCLGACCAAQGVYKIRLSWNAKESHWH